MSHLELYLLGLPRLELDDREVHITRRKAMALLAYVTLTKRTHSRDALATFLWPEYDQSQALAYLRRVLSNLNTSLAGTGLIIDRTTLRLDTASMWVDVDAFHQHLAICKSHNHGVAEACEECVSQLEKAVDLYQDDFMKGFSLRDSAAFDEWQLFQAEELRWELTFTLERLVHWYQGQKSYERAVTFAKRWLAMDPLQEPAHCALMLLFNDMGQRTAALQQYQLCMKTVQEELGTTPSVETTALYEHIRDSAGDRVDQSEVPVTLTRPLPQDQMPLHNLPAQLTSFIGREKEIRQIKERLLRPDIRLLTLTGPGGSGKTRLSLAVAEQVLSKFPDGVFFISLASLRNPVLVLDAVAQAFGLRNAGDMPLSEIIERFLAGKRILLVLDNFEHVVQAAPDIAALLKALPLLTVLVTSRSLLHVTGEYHFPVLPLDLPDSETTNLQHLAQNEAVQLFVDRAKAVKPGFTLTDQNARAVSDICTRLEGLPLAIELAAARVRLLSLTGLQSQLQNRLLFLTGGASDLPTHQRTLRSTIKWSYDLLNAEEQMLFRRLSVFAGGCTLSAAETVCNPSSDASLQAEQCLDVLHCLEKLVDQSLLQQSEVQGKARFTMLETVREYALEKLTESGELEWLQQAHTQFFLKVAEEAEPLFWGPDPAIWLQRLANDLDNLRAALAWSLNHDITTGLRLSTALTYFWLMHARLIEGRDWLDKMLAHIESQEHKYRSLRAKALSAACNLAWCQGDSLIAVTYGEQSVSILRELGNQYDLSNALWVLGQATLSFPHSNRTIPILKESIALCRKIDNKFGLFIALLHLASKLWKEGEDQLVLSIADECYQLSIELNGLNCHALTLAMQGRNHYILGDYQSSLSYREKALGLYQKAGNEACIPVETDKIAFCLFLLGQYEQAAIEYQKGLAMWLKIGNTSNAAEDIKMIGSIAWHNGDLSKAKNCFLESLKMYREVERRRFKVAWSLLGLAQITEVKEQPGRVATLIGATEAFWGRNDYTPYLEGEIDRIKNEVRNLLDKDTFDSAYTRGLAMSKQQAIDYALSEYETELTADSEHRLHFLPF